MSTVLLDVDKHIATVTLNRPEALNTMNDELRAELLTTWDRLRNDDDIRVCIVTGAGRAFCAGLDMKEAAARVQEGGPAQRRESSRLYGGHYPYDIPKPVIAAINGAAAGGGLGIALACDILIAAEEAVFVAPFAMRGTMSNPIITLLGKKVSYGWAAWMSFSGVRVDAPTALRIGLVNEVLAKDALMDRATEMAERIAGNSFAALQAIKEKLQQINEHTMDTALREDGPWVTAFVERAEAAEGFVAFAEKRRPQFS